MSSRHWLPSLLLLSGCAHPHLAPKLVTQLSSTLDAAELALSAGEFKRASDIVERARQLHGQTVESGKGTRTQREEELQPLTARLATVDHEVWKRRALRAFDATEAALARGDGRGAAAAWKQSAFARHRDAEVNARGEALGGRVEQARAKACEQALRPLLDAKDAQRFHDTLDRERRQACTEEQALYWQTEWVRGNVEECLALPALAALVPRARPHPAALERVKALSEERGQQCLARVATLEQADVPATVRALANARGLAVSPATGEALRELQRRLEERGRQQDAAARDARAAEVLARVARGEFAGACTLARKEQLPMPAEVEARLQAAFKARNGATAERHATLARQAGEAFPATAAVHARIARAHGATGLDLGPLARAWVGESPAPTAVPAPATSLQPPLAWPREVVAAAGCEPMHQGLSLSGTEGFQRIVTLRCVRERRARPYTVTVTEKHLYGGGRLPAGAIRDLNGNVTVFASHKERRVEVTEHLVVSATVVERMGAEELPVTVTLSYPWRADDFRGSGAPEFWPFELTHQDEAGNRVSLAMLVGAATSSAMSRWVEAQASWARRATSPREREEAWARLLGHEEADAYFARTYGVELKGPAAEVPCDALGGR